MWTIWEVNWSKRSTIRIPNRDLASWNSQFILTKSNSFKINKLLARKVDFFSNYCKFANFSIWAGQFLSIDHQNITINLVTCWHQIWFAAQMCWVGIVAGILRSITLESVLDVRCSISTEREVRNFIFPEERRWFRMKRLFKFLKDEEGATMVEYGLMVALIAAVCVAIVTTLGTNVRGAFTTVSNAISWLVLVWHCAKSGGYLSLRYRIPRFSPAFKSVKCQRGMKWKNCFQISCLRKQVLL